MIELLEFFSFSCHFLSTLLFDASVFLMPVLVN